MDSNAANHNNAIHQRILSERGKAFCLDRWLVLPQSNELQCLDSGQLRSLEPRLMRLLCVLAAAPQRVFSRDELMSHLWPRVIVNENSLTRAVSELRKQLAHGDMTRQLIDTIPKTGYRLSAECRVYEHEAAAREFPAVALTEGAFTDHRARFNLLSLSGMAAAASFAVAAILVVLLQIQQPLVQQHDGGLALADINLSSQEAFDALIAERLETVAMTDSASSSSNMSAQIGSLGATQPVMSRDGGLFAYIHYNDQGSSLVLGSTRLPSSPVTIFTTEDTIYNLQWSPVDRALLFAQTPKMAPAALLPMDDQASLVMFDLESFTTRVIDGPAIEAGDRSDSEELQSFKLTALGRSFDWLS